MAGGRGVKSVSKYQWNKNTRIQEWKNADNCGSWVMRVYYAALCSLYILKLLHDKVCCIKIGITPHFLLDLIFYLFFIVVTANIFTLLKMHIPNLKPSGSNQSRGPDEMYSIDPDNNPSITLNICTFELVRFIWFFKDR